MSTTHVSRAFPKHGEPVLTSDSPKVCVLCGGVGAAKFLSGLVQHVSASDLTAVVNVGDDFVLNGLYICPDIDTITYTLADQVDADRGWGLRNETWQAMESLRAYGGEDWFSLGDRDLGTHLYRTQRLNSGASLATVTTEIGSRWNIPLRLLPVSNDPVRTVLQTADLGSLSFQQYFVAHQHSVAVTAVEFVGSDTAAGLPAALDAVDAADMIIIAPSNPIVSIDPILAVGDLRGRLARRRDDVVAISPIVGGRAIKGPAARLMRELGSEASAAGVAQWYEDTAGTVIIDNVDSELASAISHCDVIVTDTIMTNKVAAGSLATAVLQLMDKPGSTGQRRQ